MCKEHNEYYRFEQEKEKEEPSYRLRLKLEEVQNDPQDPKKLQQLALAYSADGNYREAVKIYEKLLEQGIESLGIKSSLAINLRNAARVAGNVRAECSRIVSTYREAIKLYKDQDQPRWWDGEVLLEAGYPEEAAEVFRKALQKYPSDQLLLLFGRAMLEAGKVQEGVEAIDQARTLLTPRRQVFPLYVAALRTLGRIDEAEELERKIPKPDNTPSYDGYLRPLPDGLAHKIDNLYDLEQFVLSRFNLDSSKPIWTHEEIADYLISSSPVKVSPENKLQFLQHLEEQALIKIGMTLEDMHKLKRRLDEEFPEEDS